MSPFDSLYYNFSFLYCFIIIANLVLNSHPFFSYTHKAVLAIISVRNLLQLGPCLFVYYNI